MLCGMRVTSRARRSSRYGSRTRGAAYAAGALHMAASPASVRPKSSQRVARSAGATIRLASIRDTITAEMAQKVKSPGSSWRQRAASSGSGAVPSGAVPTAAAAGEGASACCPGSVGHSRSPGLSR